jgi:hypothetical protein
VDVCRAKWDVSGGGGAEIERAKGMTRARKDEKQRQPSGRGGEGRAVTITKQRHQLRQKARKHFSIINSANKRQMEMETGKSLSRPGSGVESSRVGLYERRMTPHSAAFTFNSSPPSLVLQPARLRPRFPCCGLVSGGQKAALSWCAALSYDESAMCKKRSKKRCQRWASAGRN